MSWHKRHASVLERAVPPGLKISDNKKAPDRMAGSALEQMKI
jgi:hypothetical protein